MVGGDPVGRLSVVLSSEAFHRQRPIMVGESPVRQARPASNPAYVLLPLSGPGMVAVGNLDLSTFWQRAALVPWGIPAVLGFGAHKPTVRRQIQTLEADGADSVAVRRLARRGQVGGRLFDVIVLMILFLMVTKPTL
jgi:hypothetical protein